MGGTERRPCCWLLRSEVVGKRAVATFVFIEDGLRSRARMASRSLAKGTTSEIEVVPQVVPRSAARALPPLVGRLWSSS